VVLVLDNGPIHVSKASRAALAERAHWLTVEWLPKYAPELNDIEIVWGDLKSRHLAHRTFIDLDSLDSPRRRRIEFGPKPRSVGWAENLCLVVSLEVNAVPLARTVARQ
jgi:transposase